MLGNESEEEDVNDILLGRGVGGGLMTTNEMQLFCQLMVDVVLPTGAVKLHLNLGKASNGRLKASQWLSLFTLIIPLIIPEMYIEPKERINVNSNRGRFLENTGDLIQCTRIACAPMIREGHAGRFHNAYNRYNKSSRILFNNPKIKPNHHYALHVPEQMQTWGPLMGVSEFAGERMIGMLQKIPTNQNIGESHNAISGFLIGLTKKKCCVALGEMHGTIMQRAHESQKLLANHARVRKILEECSKKVIKNKNMILVNGVVYAAMLNMLKSQGVQVCNLGHFPHPLGHWVLSQFSNAVRVVEIPKLRQNVSVLAPNNIVIYKDKNSWRHGLVLAIYDFIGPSKKQLTGIYINLLISQYQRPQYPPGHIGYYLELFGVAVVLKHPLTKLMVSPNDIIFLAAYQPLENEIFRVPSDGLILCPYNHDSAI
ncbi:hypothetical protein O181_073327 [Austropuccinia psidii MF-1]|uniref:Uncharacterized protein n=1 Tax=Austropuccinia psidii MF-1 TaxID=1389203 RepID=A0A9Q3FB18_9BASI|nr:hypothetical protein [Austropuccinia psidii MF-1]